jgi:hypothetical protein
MRHTRSGIVLESKTICNTRSNGINVLQGTGKFYSDRIISRVASKKQLVGTKRIYEDQYPHQRNQG